MAESYTSAVCLLGAFCQKSVVFWYDRRTNIATPGIERVQALADISRSALCCHSNETRAPIANPPDSAQLQGIPPTISPSYIQVRARAVVWECGEGQTDKHTERHTDAGDQYTCRVVYDSREM